MAGNEKTGMEDKEGDGGMSYRYWVRQPTADAAPIPAPKMLSPQDILPSSASSNNLGSAWNKAGTWEEKNLTNWASQRIKDLLVSIDTLQFSGGNARIAEVSRCSGDAFKVTMRNKKTFGYIYELTLKVEGEWTIKEESKRVKSNIEIPEFSFGELDDLQMQVRVNEEKDVPQSEKARIKEDLKQFLAPVREKLLQFEQELVGR